MILLTSLLNARQLAEDMRDSTAPTLFRRDLGSGPVTLFTADLDNVGPFEIVGFPRFGDAVSWLIAPDFIELVPVAGWDSPSAVTRPIIEDTGNFERWLFEAIMGLKILYKDRFHGVLHNTSTPVLT